MMNYVLVAVGIFGLMIASIEFSTKFNEQKESSVRWEQLIFCKSSEDSPGVLFALEEFDTIMFEDETTMVAKTEDGEEFIFKGKCRPVEGISTR